MNTADRTINALQGREFNFQQSENSVLGYTVNWAAVLNTDTISTSTWTGAGVSISGAANTTLTATAKINGSPGNYTIVNKIVTAAGITDERLIRLKIIRNVSYVAGDYE